MPNPFWTSKREWRTTGTLAGLRANRTKTVRSASLSARARQLTPQAIEERGFVQGNNRSAGTASPQGLRIALVVLLSAFAGSAWPPPGRPDRRPATPTAKGSPTGLPTPEPSAGAVSVSAAYTPRTSPSTTASISPGQLHDRKHPAAERSPDRRRQQPRRSRPDLLPADVAPACRPISTGTDGLDGPAGPKRRLQLPDRAAGSPRRRPADDAELGSAARLLLLRLRLPDPRRPRIAWLRSLRRPACRPHHQGQDTLAACGTPLVAAAAVVQYAGFDVNAGNYVVIDGKGTATTSCTRTWPNPRPWSPAPRCGPASRSGSSARPATRPPSPALRDLDAAGLVRSGSPIDPLPFLEKWDRYS